MPRKPIVGGNWKCNPAETAKLKELVANYDGASEVLADCDVYVCPSNLHVGMVYDKFKDGVMVAPQNCNFKVSGRFALGRVNYPLLRRSLRGRGRQPCPGPPSDGSCTLRRAAVRSPARWPSTRWSTWASSAA